MSLGLPAKYEDAKNQTIHTADAEQVKRTVRNITKTVMGQYYGWASIDGKRRKVYRIGSKGAWEEL